MHSASDVDSFLPADETKAHPLRHLLPRHLRHHSKHIKQLLLLQKPLPGNLDLLVRS